MTQSIENITIVGSGPAGWTAAIYAARAGQNPLVLEGPVSGGQLTQTTEVENFPGYPEGRHGPEMMQDFRAQAERFGARTQIGQVVRTDLTSNPKVLYLDDGSEIHTKTVIICTGASARWLGIENEERLKGFGVSACATCDGFFFRNRKLVVVGGGDTAMEEALFLSTLAESVTVVHRRDEFRASDIMAKRVLDTSNISVAWNSVVVDVLGDEAVTGVRIKNTITDEETNLEADGVFMAIGHSPNSQPFADQVKVDGVGYIIVDEPTTNTNVDGVFAAGDITDTRYRQAITAAGQGCKAALDAQRWLEKQESH
ncbi:thioredoxin-disulfide reductase [Stomatohabitans albus]|uniref:thioredoxin-disulfide reductase n=1 Tax=Stomatohabitans albus TaxID=3110766 RepID=UPI00300D1AF1